LIIENHQQNLQTNQDLIEETFNFSDRLSIAFPTPGAEKLKRLNRIVTDKEIEELISVIRHDINRINEDISREKLVNKNILKNIKREYQKQLDFLYSRRYPLRNYPSMIPKNFAQVKNKTMKRTKRTRKRTRKSVFSRSKRRR
tara:strand:+ start:4573 stop:5001 length:429 start_codon:yes stop_codon:yes gene_type:complete